MQQQQVQDLMQPVPHPLHVRMSLAEAVDLILQSGQIGLPVVDDDHHVCGFVSEHDCIDYLVSGTYHCDSRTQVGDIMYSEPLCTSPGESVIDLVQKMGGNKPKTWPVVKDGRLVGVISRRQIMQALNATMKACRSHV
ncbi:CBS domain-containing protein [Marinobacterium sp. AK62]|uniref:CBS domain-containing protein n=1 Tax=Marinobacterium alkalitolerans TaxID=1542925 RepID=A0ABS3ZFD8_9GAMM|nr:CBS domain-containing protein [Marinobacterium alkalitolerans]MBP0050040.1 CBS domain-containing protein [Marinobacterium alkalitolerans]